MNKRISSPGKLHDEFYNYGRGEQFSPYGIEALYEHIVEMEQATGEEMELDVIELCCNYTEYENKDEQREHHNVDSIAIFGILSIPIFRIGKDMVFAPFVKRYFLNVIEFSGLMVTG